MENVLALVGQILGFFFREFKCRYYHIPCLKKGSYIYDDNIINSILKLLINIKSHAKICSVKFFCYCISVFVFCFHIFLFTPSPLQFATSTQHPSQIR